MRGKSEVRSRKSEVKQPWRSGIHLVTFYVLLSATVFAADPPVHIEPASISPPVRLGKPMPTLWDVTKRQPGLLEGRIEFRVHLGPEEFFTYTTDDVVLHAPDQRLRFLFPAISSDTQTPELEVDVTWIGPSGRMPLKMQLLRVPFTARKTLLLAVGEDRGVQGREPSWQLRLSSLSAESLSDPATLERYGGRANLLQPLQTIAQMWDANSFPHDPLAYTPYDVVAVTGPVFAQLRNQPLDALETWVRSGGRLYIEADGLLENRHVEFLSRLTRHDRPAVHWSLDRVGKLDWPLLNELGEYRSQVDLGRVVIRYPLSETPEISKPSRRFLWDLPPGVDPVEQLTRLPGQPMSGQPMSGRGRFGGGMSGTVTLFAQPRVLFDNLERTLMPSGVQLVPFWLIAALLGGLVLTIGPGEWWLLGKLRLRRFTWLTWPVLTIAVTAATVGLSNWYMSTAESSRFLQLTDVGTDGRAVRSQRFEMTFPSRSREVDAEVQRGLWRTVQPPGREAGMNLYGVVIDPRTGRVINNAPPAPAGQLKPPVFAGRIPSQYTATQTVPQWTPRLTHRYELPTADEDASPVDWSRLQPLLPAGPPQYLPPELLEEVRRQLGSDAGVMLVARGGSAAHGGESLSEPHRARWMVSENVSMSPALQNAGLPSVLWMLTHQQRDLGTDPWAMSSDRFGWSDLTLLSQSGPYDLAVLLVTRDGGGWQVYRRPYRFAELLPSAKSANDKE